MTAERHGAIRVGSPRELAQAARVFAGFGMYPVGFYDLRDASKSSVPVVSTAFRPVDADELARNPFRVFTSMLVATDRRFFDAGDASAAGGRSSAPGPCSGRSCSSWPTGRPTSGGLDAADADRFLDLATAAFELSTEPVDHDWYFALERISAVAADIGGVPSTHINHLTPRVLDIDDLYQRMEARGITMIDEIQGPPDWEGPDVLLRQTSFKALAEERQFRHADGSVRAGSLRVRFGEVEQRGVALTAAGARPLRPDGRRGRCPRWPRRRPAATRVEVAREVWRENLPRTERELAAAGTGVLHLPACRPARRRRRQPARASCGAGRGRRAGAGADRLRGLPAPVRGRHLPVQPDRRGHPGRRPLGTPYDIDMLSEVIGRPIADPTALYEAQQSASLAAAAEQLGLTAITTDSAMQPTPTPRTLMSTDFPTTAEITADVAAGPEGHRRRHRRDRRRHRGPHPDHRRGDLLGAQPHRRRRRRRDRRGRRGVHRLAGGAGTRCAASWSSAGVSC